MLLASACQQEVPLIEEEIVEGEDVADETIATEEPESKSSETALLSSRETTVAESDSTLKDTTGYGFAYDANNVLDLDYSTAWCRGTVSAEDGTFAGGLTLTFTESPAGKIMGVMPGYARDETIFWQNNRIKTLALVSSASPLLEDATLFEFEDKYEMQFFQLPSDIRENFVLFVSEVYPGSKYDDTCIAEIDLWSDWVAEKDAVAAYDYYLENKAAYAQ